MADQTPDNDPLGNRLRAIFAAEHADIERRHLAQGAASTSARSLKWVPFAMAAAVIAIAGFVFIGSRSSDQAVELDVAAHTSDNEAPDSQVPAGGTPVPIDESGQPIPTPSIPMPNDPGVMVPYQTGVNMCADSYRPDAYVVNVDPGGSVPVQAEPEASTEIGVTRILLDGTAVELAGGCTSAATSTGTFQWFEIQGAPGEPNEWIRSDYLATQDLPDPNFSAPNECGTNVPRVPHFVWDIPVDDPEGGLVTHTSAGVNQPVARVIKIGSVVQPTQGCVLTANGSAWYELFAPGGGFEWVNARYLRVAEQACIVGEQFGAPAQLDIDEEPFFVTVANGDLLSSIAQRYNVTVDVLISANPHLDLSSITPGELLRVPGATTAQAGIIGPANGWAVVDGDRVAFTKALKPPQPVDLVLLINAHYSWYPAGGVAVGAPCDLLEDRGCMRVTSPVASSSSTPLGSVPWFAGDASSGADHIHDIRIESNDKCTRIVITFGDNANEGAADGVAAIVPPVVIEHGSESVRISANGWQMESAFRDPDRIDYPGGIGLLTLSPGFEFAVELMHSEMEPNVRFFDDPARVVVDLFPVDAADQTSTGPFGERFVLRGPIQQDLTGSGIPVDNNIVVAGFGRPFEAAGLYRIWAVPDDIDPDAFLADPPAPLIEEFFATSGWAEGWGSFFVDLPDLDPGTYIAVFGELPPTDEIGFYGTGQLFRVTDSPNEEPGKWPEAVLLPNVQLPPEPFD